MSIEQFFYTIKKAIFPWVVCRNRLDPIVNDEEYQVKTDPLNIDHPSTHQLSIFPWVVKTRGTVLLIDKGYQVNRFVTNRPSEYRQTVNKGASFLFSMAGLKRQVGQYF